MDVGAIGAGMQVVRERVRAVAVEAGTKAEVEVAKRAAITVAAAEFVEDTMVCLVLFFRLERDGEQRRVGMVA